MNVVYAEAVGSIDMETRRETGKAYINEDIDLAEKDAVVASGLDSLSRHFSGLWTITNPATVFPPPDPPKNSSCCPAETV
ncbi:MAG: hypothetical protein U5N26_11250 [Candidatus Marinimicrobia bacterium]|nr:hypothetical protein [Candidatus Neomarinimicrobiota bacterium]